VAWVGARSLHQAYPAVNPHIRNAAMMMLNEPRRFTRGIG